MDKNTRIDSAKLPLKHMFDFALILFFLLLGYIYTQGIESVLDIGLWDESSYLNRGLRIGVDGFPAAQDAPLYAFWYFILSFFQSDAIDLYFLNYKLITFLPPLILFVTLRAYRVSRILSLIVSAAFLFSFANFPTWPKVSHFAILVLLCGFLLCSFVRDVKLKTCTMLITALLASYIRPEFFLAFFCLTLVLFYLTFLAKDSSRSIKSAIPMLATMIPCIIVIAWLGQPMDSGKRSMVAFGQHYARNWVRWHNDERNPWTNWNTIVAADFGRAASPREALLKNPSAVMRHVFQNLQSLPHDLKVMFIPEYPSSDYKNVTFSLSILVLTALVITLLRQQTIIEAKNRLQDNWIALRFQIGLLIITLLPVVISVLLIAPRHHYLLILGVLLAFGLITLLFRNTDQDRGYAGHATVALLCIALLSVTQPAYISINPTSQPNLNTIKFLRTLNVIEPTNILEAEGGYGIYVGDNYTRIGEYDKTTHFREFLVQKSINMIVVSDRLTRDARIHGDPEWHAFINDPSQFGFSQLQIANVKERSLYVRIKLIKNKI